MSDINDSIAEYKEAVGEIPSIKADDAEKKILRALLARDRVARELGRAATIDPQTIIDVGQIDRQLRTGAIKINKIIGPDKLAEWRATRQLVTTPMDVPKQGDEWWWSLTAPDDGKSMRERVTTVLLWLSVFISLSFIIESLRRFLSSEVGVLGTVLQGIVALLVGSSLVQFAGQLAGRSGTKADEKVKPTPLSRRLIFPAPFVVMALVMWFLLPWIVGLYSDRGVEKRQQGQLAHPISYYQRSISLDPSDAVAHYNLARAYEVIAEYDKAESEYKSALRWDEANVVAYDGLAHFIISQKKSFATALRLLNTGLDKLEAQKSARDFKNEDDYKRIKVSLLRNRAWAYFEMKYFTQAEDDLRVAIDLKPDAAAPHCLLGQVLEEKEKVGSNTPNTNIAQEARKAYTNCVAFSEGQNDKIEPDWVAHAQERLNQESEKESAEATKKKPGGKT